MKLFLQLIVVLTLLGFAAICSAEPYKGKNFPSKANLGQLKYGLYGFGKITTISSILGKIKSQDNVWFVSCLTNRGGQASKYPLTFTVRHLDTGLWVVHGGERWQIVPQ